ncbi:F0F1 ATP synthase subunit A [Mycoplasmopsis cynos]|nr:F0F1 ATP synthase subunit A [Mycoplasmopsis cynos]
MKEGTKFDLWNWKQPQLISLIITVLIIFIFSITIYLKVRKTKANKASKGIVQIAEAYVGMVEANFESVAGPTKIKPAKIYIFTLGTFLLVGNLVVLFGFEPIVTSYSVPFTLAIFTWFGVMLVGTIYEKLKFYRKLLIPTELIGKLSIIVSLSLRIYGNIIGGSYHFSISLLICWIYVTIGIFCAKYPKLIFLWFNNHTIFTFLFWFIRFCNSSSCVFIINNCLLSNGSRIY